MRFDVFQVCMKQIIRNTCHVQADEKILNNNIAREKCFLSGKLQVTLITEDNLRSMQKYWVQKISFFSGFGKHCIE